MRSRSELPWSERLRRDLQSLRDRAPRLSRSDGALGPWCEQCEEQPAAFLIPGEALPHWLVHEVVAIVGGIRWELTWEMLDRPFGDGTVGDGISGVGNVPIAERTPEMLHAERIAFDHHRLVELWLREEMRVLEPWVTRILKAGVRVARDAPIAADYLEWLVLASPHASWRAVCEEWGRRLGATPVSRTPELRPPALVFPVPEWVIDDERRLLVGSAEWVIEEGRRARMRELVPVVRRIADLQEQREELFIAEQEMLQEAVERGAELCADIAAQPDDFSLVLAAAVHAAETR